MERKNINKSFLFIAQFINRIVIIKSRVRVPKVKTQNPYSKINLYLLDIFNDKNYKLFKFKFILRKLNPMYFNIVLENFSNLNIKINPKSYCILKTASRFNTFIILYFKL